MRYALLNAFDIAACFQTKKKNGKFDIFFTEFYPHIACQNSRFPNWNGEKKRWIEYLERILIKVLTSGGNDIGKRDSYTSTFKSIARPKYVMTLILNIYVEKNLGIFTLHAFPYGWNYFRIGIEWFSFFYNCFKHQNSRFISVFEFIYFFRFSFTFLIYDEHLNFYFFFWLSSNKFTSQLNLTDIK